MADRREAWLLHGGLFLITILCALGAGAALAGRYEPPVGDGVIGWLAAGLRFFPHFLRQPSAVILAAGRSRCRSC
jgi:hypothetical protein